MLDKKTILCVDDEVDILELFKCELEDNNFNVLCAENGEAGWELFKNNTVDCVISDIRMPGGDGVELSRNIKKINKEVPIFLVTGFSDYTAEELSRIGVQAVISKPFDLEEVVKMITRSIRT